MKKNVGMATIVALVCLLPVFVGCSITDAYVYENAGKYTAGNGTAADITNVEIDWIDGSVEVFYDDVEDVTFYEEAQESLSLEETLHYWVENSTLHIKFGKAKGLLFKNAPKKDLKVALPHALSLSEMEISTVNADINLSYVMVKDLGVECVDADVNAYLVGASEKVSIETVDGDVRFGGEKLTELNLESVDGEFNVKTGELFSLDVDTVAGNVQFSSEVAPKEVDFNSVDGDLIMELGQVSGFSFKMETVSGAFNCEFETTLKQNRYVYGTGEGEYKADTVDGDVTIYKLAL